MDFFFSSLHLDSYLLSKCIRLFHISLSVPLAIRYSYSPFLGKYKNSGVNAGMNFSAIVSALKLAAFPCFPQVDEIFCVREVALIFCVDHRVSSYLT